MRKKNKLVYGVGINDADYFVQPYVNGRQVCCPYYKKWKGMLERCYDAKLKSDHPTYNECSVCPDWIYFSRFKSWMECQDWVGKDLDKDILHKGNKMYSPELCVFVNQATNKFIIDSMAARGNYPIGVSFHKCTGKFMSACGNPLTKRYDYIGVFDTVEEAHMAWRLKKQEYSLYIASIQTDSRVADAIIERYRAEVAR